MPQSLFQSQLFRNDIAKQFDTETLRDAIRPKLPDERPLPPRIPAGYEATASARDRRRHILEEQQIELNALAGADPMMPPKTLTGNIENFAGVAQVPVGVVGPLRINGLYAQGDFYVPLATTEGAMVASYQRGAHVMNLAGGPSVMCISSAVSRAPCFIFDKLYEATLFLDWIYDQADELAECVKRSTAHGRLIDIVTTLNSSQVYLTFEYDTGDAAGQNMVTLATEAACEYIVSNSPIPVKTWYLEANLSGDKKASMLSFMGVRGKKVTAEISIPPRLIRRYLHTTPEAMAHYCHTSWLGGIQSGGIGIQGHVANALAGIFIACGQDVACVSEAAVGITEMLVSDAGNLKVNISLPNLTVGTVGGGTHLPTARECLQMLGCFGSGKARKFAEVCTATALAGEVSIIAALAAGHFGKAHARFRHKPGNCE